MHRDYLKKCLKSHNKFPFKDLDFSIFHKKLQYGDDVKIKVKSIVDS